MVKFTRSVQSFQRHDILSFFLLPIKYNSLESKPFAFGGT